MAEFSVLYVDPPQQGFAEEDSAMMFQEAPNSKVTGPIFTDGGPKKPTNSAAMPPGR